MRVRGADRSFWRKSVLLCVLQRLLASYVRSSIAVLESLFADRSGMAA